MILQNKGSLTLVLFVVTGSFFCMPVVAAEMTTSQAWKALPKYEYGQDMAALLAIDRAVIRAMASPETQSACAKRLASLLASDDTTLPARQYICLQLRQIGTAAEVPVLARRLAESETSSMARYALESIPGPESLAALRNALTTLRGKPLIGVINSVAARKDPAAVTVLGRLADSQDPPVAAAAVWALGNIANRPAVTLLRARAKQAGIPTPENLAVPLLRCADALLREEKTDQAKAIYAKLSQPGQVAAIRRAAFHGLLRCAADQATATVLSWLSDPDPQRRRVAIDEIHNLSDSQLDRLISHLSDLPAASKLAVIELGAARRGKKILPLAHALVQSPNPELQRTGIRCLGLVGDASAIPVLVNTLSAEDDLSAAAQNALAHLPPKDVAAALLDALRNRPATRTAVIRVLVKLKCYEAIDPLVDLALQPNATQYGPALEGLKGIADPDKTDVRRLVKLLLRTERGKHRDEVEKTILVVCDKLPAEADRSELVLSCLARSDAAEAPTYLPLLGRLGGPKALQVIQTSLASKDSATREAAIRALCNWPNDDVADKLLELAKTADNPTHRRWALRAYIRVITLKSDRPEPATLALLQNSMQLAESIDDKRLALKRAATIRTLATVQWLAPYLDTPELAQTACRAIVDLAHHRFLRQPNKDQFGPILEKVARISVDPSVVERAKRYRLGL